MILIAARQVFAYAHVKHPKRLARMLSKQASTFGMSLEHAPLTIASLVVDVKG